MNKWIKLNLPYSLYKSYNSKRLSYPYLAGRAAKELGFTRKDLDKLYDKLSFESIRDILEKIDGRLDKKYVSQSDEWRQARIVQFLKSENKNVKLFGNYLEKSYQYENWKDKQPEIIVYHKKYDKQYRAHKEEVAKKSFSGLKLDRPGTLIEIEVKKKTSQYLIGHINPLAGVCDDCCQFDKETAIVKRYKVLIEFK